MRILVIKSAEIIPYMVSTLVDMGHEVTYMSGENVVKSTDSLAERLSEYLTEKNTPGYDLVISFDFFYMASIACREHGVKYVSWVFDSPQAELFHPEVYSENNYVFIFDKAQFERIRQRGDGNIYHLPLSGDVEGLKDLSVSSDDLTRFGKEISFVGNMYEGNVYNQYIRQIPQTEVSEIQGYLMDHLCNWNDVRAWPKVSEKTVEFFKKISPKGAEEAYEMPLDEYYGSILLSRKLAEMERLTLLHKLAEREEVSVFTNSTQRVFASFNGRVYPPVDYISDMRKVFHLSRINLNITMPSIETGIPLRVYDIMSVGGFCLTNWQEEIEDRFEIGTDLEVFHDLDELYEKARFYLTHEDIRLKIAVRGYQKICSEHTYRHRLTRILQIATGGAEGVSFR